MNSLSLFFVKVQHLIGFIYIPMFKFALYIIAPFYVIFSPRAKSRLLELTQICIYYFWMSYYLSYIETW